MHVSVEFADSDYITAILNCKLITAGIRSLSVVQIHLEEPYGTSHKWSGFSDGTFPMHVMGN